MKVKELMTKEPVACRASDTVRHAASLMKAKNVGCVVALQDLQVTGILTDRDVCLALADGHEDAPVADIMTREVGLLHPDDSVFHAVDTFRSAGVVRRLPVVNERDQLVGILSVSDLAVVVEDLNKAVFLEARHNALDEPHLLTGGKEMVKRIRRPKKADRMPQRAYHAVGPATPGPPRKSGRGSA